MLQITHDAIKTLTLGKLANIQTVGIGLYLALAVVQSVSSGGVSGLRRRASSLQATVRAARLVHQYAAVRNLQSEVNRLEVSFQALNRTVIRMVTFLFIISVIYFAYCTVFQDTPAKVYEVIFITVFYLFCPTFIFSVLALIISQRCKSTTAKIRMAEARFKNEACSWRKTKSQHMEKRHDISKEQATMS